MTRYLHNAGLGLAGWLLYCLFMVTQGSISSSMGASNIVLILVVPGLFLAGLLAVLTYYSRKFQQGFRVSAVKVLLLVILDQGLKLLVEWLGGAQLNLTIIPGLAYISPTYNTYGSYIGSLLGVKIPDLVYLVCYALLLVVLYYIYRAQRNKIKDNFWLSTMLLTLVSGAIAASLDKIFWHGTLDTLYIKPLFVCDLKDFYIIIAMFAVVIITWELETPKRFDRTG